MLVLNTVFIQELFKAIDFLMEIMFFLSWSVMENTKFEILVAIIGSYTVFVMNSFVFSKWASKSACHYQTVFKNARRSIISIALSHSWFVAKLLIFNAKAFYNKCDISGRTKDSFIIFLVSRIRAWRFSRTVDTKTSKSKIGYCGSTHQSISSAFSTCYPKRQIVLVVDNFIPIPVNSASTGKVRNGNRISIWFSTHGIFTPHCRIGSVSLLINRLFTRFGIIADNPRLCGGY